MTKSVREELAAISARDWENMIVDDLHAALDKFDCAECGDSGVAVGYRKVGDEYVRFTEPCLECSKGRAIERARESLSSC